MPARHLLNAACCAVAAMLVCACASGNRTATATPEGAGRVTLTPEQGKAIEGGVTQMVERSDGVKISAVTATKQPDKPGLQVCGFASVKDASGKQGPDHPFYIELLEKEGKAVAERGQVGSDPARLSKVTFMCRRNG